MDTKKLPTHITALLVLLVPVLWVLSVQISYRSGLSRAEARSEFRHNLFVEEIRGNIVKSYLQSTDVNAETVVVFDLNKEEVVFEKNSEELHNLASLVKILTAQVAGLGSGDSLKIETSDLTAIGDFGLEEGDSWSTGDLAKMILLNSSNDAAFALARHFGEDEFIDKMNIQARELGVSDSFVVRDPAGYEYGDAQKASMGTALDVIKLYQGLVESGEDLVFTAQIYTDFEYIRDSQKAQYIAENTNPYVDQMENLIFSKTGYTDLAGGHLLVVTKDDQENNFAVLVMNSTFEGRFNDVKNILSALNNVDDIMQTIISE